ncbi:MAG: putative aminophospholipid-translocase [Chrysothrix sp. TS-e1954]|nr:MAG: putative aminophospholipid-translocase [Chrysothrix sp. TS-e1954]
MPRYQTHSHHPHNSGEDSDEDLTLDELDPLPSEAVQPRKPNGRGHGNGAVALNELKATDHPRSNGHRSRPRGRWKDGSEEDLETLLGDHTHSDELGRGLGSTDHDADNSQDPPPHLDAFRRLRRKLSSTPRSEVEAEYDPASNRLVVVGRRWRFPPNVVSNAKYTPWSFLPRTLYNEFSFFFNLYFLLVALSQIIPALRIGYLSTYVAPLAFVLVITLGKEAYDDITRRRRDAELNAEHFTVLSFDDPHEDTKDHEKRRRKKGHRKLPDKSRVDDADDEEADLDGRSSGAEVDVQDMVKASKDLKVGDVLRLEKDRRVPADAVVLKCLAGDALDSDSSSGGEAFIRTDQLDGETDWKLRLATPLSQQMTLGALPRLRITASKPSKKVNEFIGTLSLSSSRDDQVSVPLTIDNTIWANTFLASSATVFAVIIYTGPQTRQALSTSASRSKTGLLEYEINVLTKILCALVLLLSFVLVALQRFEAPDVSKWYVAVMRYLVLFSTIVPISLRVNVDMGKSVYAWFMEHDQDIPETTVRTSSIPEDLGRIEYLLSDKTGTLTQNDMILRKVHVGTVSYANEAMSEVATYIRQGFADQHGNDSNPFRAIATTTSATRSRREISSRVRNVVIALALCHNVTPIAAMEDGKETVTYQASSPDEIAIVKWTESVGLRLAHRDRHSMTLESTHLGQIVSRVEILNLFPFTSESKRMGVILRFLPVDVELTSDDTQGDQVWFFQKGADTVMSSIVTSNDWLDEETANMAREGLRTLVVGRKKLSTHQYNAFVENYKNASLSLKSRDSEMAAVVRDHLEQDLELLGVTGVEDKLQKDVKPSLELLRNAGIKIWMLTGDKVETARCVAISSKLVARGQYVHTISKLTRLDAATDHLDFLRSKPDACLLIDGDSLAIMLADLRNVFIPVAARLAAVVACRCSPTQKAEMVNLIRWHTDARICAIGDGGNDVSMIQAADVGVGIVGKEGRQASLAADFSIIQFKHLTKLLVWHGRNSYKRSAKLAQFIIHRGLIISVCQTIYSIAAKFRPDALYRDWLLVGYATVYTMFPVFSLVLDTDIPPQLAHLYPELYAELQTSRSLSYRTFFIWVAISLYQGCAIQILSHVLVGVTEEAFPRMVSVSFTVLVINELVMVAAEVTTWHWIMIASIAGTAAIYGGSVPFLGQYFDLDFVASVGFVWRVAAIAAISLVPVYASKLIRRTVKPPSYRKMSQQGHTPNQSQDSTDASEQPVPQYNSIYYRDRKAYLGNIWDRVIERRNAENEPLRQPEQYWPSWYGRNDHDQDAFFGQYEEIDQARKALREAKEAQERALEMARAREEAQRQETEEEELMKRMIEQGHVVPKGGAQR